MSVLSLASASAVPLPLRVLLSYHVGGVECNTTFGVFRYLTQRT